MPLNERRQILNSIFETDGIIHSDGYEQDIKIEALSQQITNFPKFYTYFDVIFPIYVLLMNDIQKQIKPLLKSSVSALVKGQLWTNNNAESINAMVRSHVDYEPNLLDSLILKLHSLVKHQQIHETRAALHNIGSYKLVDVFKRYQVTQNA